MLPKERANYYYESLRFNHYDSGGTCEQRVLVLRARFDRILEELAIKDFNSQGAYVEKLQQVFKALPERFTEDVKKECHALRKYLNGVQHSTYAADESQYRVSVKRLCDLIYLCSNLDIPQEVEQIWCCPNITNVCNHKDIEIKPTEQTINHKCKELPVVVCVDCCEIEGNEINRNQINQSLLNLISDISDNDLCVNLRLILIEKNRIKYIVPQTGEISSFNYQQIESSIVVGAINNSCEFIESRISFYNQNKYSLFNPSGLFVCMFSSKLLNLLNNSQRTISAEATDMLHIIPIGLTKGMDLEPFRLVSEKSQPMVLRGDKYEEFFNWLYESLRSICND